jgi:hypothetical protein
VHLTDLNKKLNDWQKKRIKVDILDLETNKTNTYESIDKAARAINSHSKTLLIREKSELKTGVITPYRGRYLITILRNGTKLSTDQIKNLELARKNLDTSRAKWAAAFGLKVIVTNIKTNKSKEYDSISDAAKMLITSRRTISRYIKSQKVFNELYSITLK